MADHLKGRRIKPQSATPVVQQFRAKADEAITAGQVVYPSGTDGEWTTVAVADKDDDKVKVGGLLFVALNTCAAGDELLVTTMAQLNTLVTTGSSVGAPVWLTDAGAVSLTMPTSGHVRKVGEVTTVGTIAAGAQWTFQGVQRHIIVGKGTVLSGQSALTIAAATIGGNFGGAPVIACMNEDDTTVGIVNATWSTNDLVVNLNGNATADRDFTYMIIL